MGACIIDDGAGGGGGGGCNRKVMESIVMMRVTLTGEECLLDPSSLKIHMASVLVYQPLHAPYEGHRTELIL